MNSASLAARRIVSTAMMAAFAAIAAACSSGGGSSSSSSASPPVSGATSAPTAAPASSPASASATSPAQAGPGVCRTAGLRVTKVASNGTAGTIYYNVDFSNASASPCVLQGYPGASLVSSPNSAGSQIGADAKRITTSPVRAITIAPGQTAHAALGVAEAGNYPAAQCNPVTAHWLKVFPPGMRTAAYVPFSTQTCASTSQPTMTITAIAPGA